MDTLLINQIQQQSWKEARQFLVERRLDKAIPLLATLSQSWHEPELWLDYAYALFLAKDYPKAQGIVATILREYPLSSRAHHLQADLKYKQNFFKEALTGYRYVLSKDPKHLTSLISTAYCYCQLQSFEEALPFFEQSEPLIDSPPGSWLVNYGMALVFSKKPQRALLYLSRALETYPQDAQLHFHCGLSYGLIGDSQNAQHAYKLALVYDPHLMAAHHNLAMLYYAEEEYDRAAEHLRFITEHDPLNTVAKTLLTAYEGSSLDRLPSSFIQTLFDQYAFNYNAHLKEGLGYQAPTTARALLAKITKQHLSAGITLDLGCGTGLAGPVFRDLATQLIGVDLSGGMLAQAKELGLYDQLIEDDVLSFLSKTTQRPNFILAFELSNYLGPDLALMIERCAQILEPGGWLLMTCEISPDQDIQLTKHARYAFSQNYIENILNTTSLSLKHCCQSRLRLHHDRNIDGYFIFAQKT